MWSSRGGRGWRICSRVSRAGSRGWSRGGMRRPMCVGCWRRWSARTGGRWPSGRVPVRRTGCRTCCRARAGMPTLVRDDVRAYVVEHLGDPDGVLIADETGFREEGRPVGRGAAAVLGHGGADRELPDRRVPGLRLGAWAGADRPGVVPAGVVDRATGTGAGRRRSRTRWSSRPSRSRPGRCWNGRSRPGCRSRGSPPTRPTGRTRACGPGWRSRTSPT